MSLNSWSPLLGLWMWATILITLYIYYILSQSRNFYWYNLLALFRSHKFCIYTCVCVKPRLVCLVLYSLVMCRLRVPLKILCYLPPHSILPLQFIPLIFSFSSLIFSFQECCISGIIKNNLLKLISFTQHNPLWDLSKLCMYQ